MMKKETKQKVIVEILVKLLGFFMTSGGVIWFIFGDFTNGLLLMILGELVDLPYRIASKLTP